MALNLLEISVEINFSRISTVEDKQQQTAGGWVYGFGVENLYSGYTCIRTLILHNSH
jgi:hypothetical protein